MANCFGEVVDNYKLDGMARYVGRPKTQEDRAREASKLVNENGKNAKAASYVQGLKKWYGHGQTTLCLVYNATGDTISYVADHDWWGFIGRTPYPTEIGNGQWGAFHHVHRTGSVTSGSEGAVVYRGKNKSGQLLDYLIAWDSPWHILTYRNKAYCEIGSVNSFQSRWSELQDMVENGYDTWTAKTKDGCEIEVSTATGDDPMFTAILKTSFNP